MGAAWRFLVEFLRVLLTADYRATSAQLVIVGTTDMSLQLIPGSAPSHVEFVANGLLTSPTTFSCNNPDVVISQTGPNTADVTAAAGAAAGAGNLVAQASGDPAAGLISDSLPVEIAQLATEGHIVVNS